MDEAKEVLTAREAAQLLSLHEKTLIRKAREGAIPGARVGREWRFSRRQVVAWVENGGYREAKPR